MFFFIILEAAHGGHFWSVPSQFYIFWSAANVTRNYLGSNHNSNQTNIQTINSTNNQTNNQTTTQTNNQTKNLVEESSSSFNMQEMKLTLENLVKAVYNLKSLSDFPKVGQLNKTN